MFCSVRVCKCVCVCLMIDKCWMWSIKLSISDLNNWSTQVVNVAKHLMVRCVAVSVYKRFEWANERMSEYACRVCACGHACVLFVCMAFHWSHQNFVFVSNHFAVVYSWKETIFTNNLTDSRSVTLVNGFNIQIRIFRQSLCACVFWQLIWHYDIHRRKIEDQHDKCVFEIGEEKINKIK